MNPPINSDLIDLNSISLKYNKKTTTSNGYCDHLIIEALKNYCSEKNENKLKELCRRGGWTCDDSLRLSLWSMLSCTYRRSNSEPLFDFSIDDAYNLPSFDCVRKLPGFVDPSYCRYYLLNQKGQRTVEKILWCLSTKHNEITFCPTLYPIVALFLHFNDVRNTLKSLTYLLEAPSSGIRGKDYECNLISQSRTQHERQAYVLVRLTNQFRLIPPRNFFSNQRKKLLIDREIDPFFRDWLKWIFIGLPFEHVVRILDCYIVEGIKFLYRVAIVLLVYFRRSKHFSINIRSMMTFCEEIQMSPDELVNNATNLNRISRPRICKCYGEASRKCQVKHSPSHTLIDVASSLQESSPRHQEMVSLDSIRISEGSRIAPYYLKSSIVDWFFLDTIWDWLPERAIVKSPVIAFCTDEHGSSLNTFFQCVDKIEHTLLLVKTTENEVFGAFCSSPWTTKSTDSQFFGTGETFLFALIPNIKFYPWIGLSSSNSSNCPAFFMSTHSRRLAVGCGGGIGLMLDENLTRGRTEKCETFENEPLSSKSDFTVSIIEVIAFRPD